MLERCNYLNHLGVADIWMHRRFSYFDRRAGLFQVKDRDEHLPKRRENIEMRPLEDCFRGGRVHRIKNSVL